MAAVPAHIPAAATAETPAAAPSAVSAPHAAPATAASTAAHTLSSAAFVASAPAAATAATVQQVVAGFLGVAEVQLFQLSAKTLEGAKAALALPLAQQAALDIFLASPPPSSAEDLTTKVASLFSVTEEERKYPWRATLRLVREAFDTMAGVDAERSKALFADMAKQGSLTPDVAATLQMLLFWSPDEQLAYASSLLHYNAAQCLQVFNHIASSRQPKGLASTAEQFVRERGSAIVTLNTPLWPREHAFATCQLQQLQGSASVSGGGVTARRSFAAASAQGCGFGAAVGGGYAPVGQLQDGSWAADTSAAEAAAAKETASLRRQVVALERKLGRGQQVPERAAHYQGAQQQQQQYQQQQQHYAHRGRGRGGARGTSGGGHAEQEPSSAPTAEASAPPAPPATVTKRWDPLGGARPLGN